MAQEIFDDTQNHFLITDGKSIHDMALSYVFSSDGHKKSVIPTNGKVPIIAWSEYKNRFPTEVELKEWFENKENNIAIVCGKLSDLIVLDFEKEFQDFSSLELPKTIVVSSGGGGKHFYYKYPQGREIGCITKIDGRAMDLKGEGGLITAPPSIHPNGNIYKLDIANSYYGFKIADAPDWLIQKGESYAKKNNDWGEIMQGVPAGQRNETAASVAGKILSGLKAEDFDSVGWPLLEGWNMRCNPPLPSKELWAVFCSIKKLHLRKKNKRHFNSNQFTDINPESNEESIDSPKYKFTSLGDLLNEPEEEISWVVDGLLPTGGFSVLVAKPKVGKSTLARQLALSVAKGELFLGMATVKGRVLYVALEEKRSEAKNHFRLMSANEEDNMGVYTGSAPGDANSWLKNEVKRECPILIIIDTLFRFARVNDVNDYAKITNALDPLLSLAREYNTHLMVLHHARKSIADGADGILGSTAIFGSVDTAIILKKNEGKRTMETEQRYGKNMEPRILLFDDELKITTLGISKEKDELAKIQAETLQFLGTNNEPVEESIICENITGRTALKRQAIRQLVLEHKIIRAGNGKKGSPFLYSCSLVPSIYVEQENK